MVFSARTAGAEVLIKVMSDKGGTTVSIQPDGTLVFCITGRKCYLSDDEVNQLELEIVKSSGDIFIAPVFIVGQQFDGPLLCVDLVCGLDAMRWAYEQQDEFGVGKRMSPAGGRIIPLKFGEHLNEALDRIGANIQFLKGIEEGPNGK